MATLFVNGRIHTLDPRNPLAEAVACSGGRVLAVGTAAQVRAYAQDGAHDEFDLQGHTVVPGFVDAHIHLRSLGAALNQVDLGGAASLAECVERVRAFAERAGARGWIVGRGWNQNDWSDAPWPDRRALDAVTGGRPAALGSKDGHLLWVNSAALAAAGITATSPDPEGGAISRDEHGEPTGLLKENATRAIYAAMPAPSEHEVEADLLRAAEHALALGVTAVGNFEGPEVLRALGRLRVGERLRLRVVQHISHDALEATIAAGVTSGLGDEWLRVGALKLFADGTLGSQTALMLEPYEGAAGNRGIRTLALAVMEESASRAAAVGIATAIHAIGDRANRDALGVLAGLPRVPALPHRVEHAQLLHPDDLATFARAGIVASMQPIHAVGDRDTADAYWGDRCATAYAWRSLEATGAALAFGSDAPVESCDPLQGLFAAVERHARDDGRAGWRTEQALDLPAALRAYTIVAASAGGMGHLCGMLRPGYTADMAVLSQPIFDGPAALEGARVVATILSGVVVSGTL